MRPKKKVRRRLCLPAPPKTESKARENEGDNLRSNFRKPGSGKAATAEVLSLIADAPTDLLQVFDRIVRKRPRGSARVCSAPSIAGMASIPFGRARSVPPESVAAVREAYPAPLTATN